MAIVTRFPTGASPSQWTNPTYAFSADNNWTYASPSAYSTYEYLLTNFGFDSAIPVEAVINSVTLEVKWRISTASSQAEIGVCAYVSGAVSGDELTEYNSPTTAQIRTTTNTGITSRTQLLNVNFRVRLRASQISTTACTFYVDYVKVVVDYSVPPPPPIITVTSATRSKLGLASGTTVSTVLFHADQDLDEWEARAGGTARGQGLLVGSGKAEGPELLTENQQSVETDLTGYSTYESVTISRDTTTAAVGAASLKATPSDDGFVIIGGMSPGLGIVINGVAGDTFIFKFQAKTSADWSTIDFVFVDCSNWYNAVGGTVISDLMTATGWSDVVTIEVELIADVSEAFLGLSSQPNLGGYRWYDNLSLKKVGTTIPANTDITFDVETAELSQGDGAYRITVYGKNSEGVWSAYG